MKKKLALLVIAVMLSLSGCGNDYAKPQDESISEATEVEETETKGEVETQTETKPFAKSEPTNKFISKIIYSGYSDPTSNAKLTNTIYDITYDEQGRVIECSKYDKKKSYVTYEYENDERQPSTVVEDNGSKVITTNLTYDEDGYVKSYEETIETVKGTETNNYECNLSITSYEDGESIENMIDPEKFSVTFDEDGQITQFISRFNTCEFEYEDGVKTAQTIGYLINDSVRLSEYEFIYDDGLISQVEKNEYCDDKRVGGSTYTVEYEFDEDGDPVTITVYEDGDTLKCKYQITYIEMDMDIEANFSEFRHQSMYTHVPMDFFNVTKDYVLYGPMIDVFGAL